MIVGARGTVQEGWESTNRNNLDIRNYDSWQNYFQSNSIDAVLSEHVLEHLNEDDALITAQNIFEFLRSGGHWRIAVPDAANPDPVYQDMVRPGGNHRAKMQWWNQALHGQDEPDHLVHYDLDSLTQLLQYAGFIVKPLEWYQGGVFHAVPWSFSDGMIRRSSRSLYLICEWFIHGVWNTSLIVDAVKP